jgi:hypothetical protein
MITPEVIKKAEGKDLVVFADNKDDSNTYSTRRLESSTFPSDDLNSNSNIPSSEL